MAEVIGGKAGLTFYKGNDMTTYLLNPWGRTYTHHAADAFYDIDLDTIHSRFIPELAMGELCEVVTYEGNDVRFVRHTVQRIFTAPDPNEKRGLVRVYAGPMVATNPITVLSRQVAQTMHPGIFDAAGRIRSVGVVKT